MMVIKNAPKSISEFLSSKKCKNALIDFLVVFYILEESEDSLRELTFLQSEVSLNLFLRSL